MNKLAIMMLIVFSSLKYGKSFVDINGAILGSSIGGVLSAEDKIKSSFNEHCTGPKRDNIYYEVNGTKVGYAGYQVCPDAQPGLNRLIILIEAYDIFEDMDYQTLFMGMQMKDVLAARAEPTQNTLNLLTELNNLGYDVALINVPDFAFNSLQNSAVAVAMAIQELWNMSPKEIPVKIVGLSAGGLLGVMAADWGERKLNKFNFKTSLVLTVDTPHRGAFLPTSIQNFIITNYQNGSNYWQGGDLLDAAISAEVTKKIQNSVSYFHKVLSGTASRQLLLNPVLSPDRVEHNAFYSYYDKLTKAASIDLPIRFAGVAMGSWNGKPQAGTPGALVLEVNGMALKETKTLHWMGIDWYDAEFKGGLHTQLFSQKSYPSNMDVTLNQHLKLYEYVGINDGHQFFPKVDFDCPNPGQCDSFEKSPGGKANFYQDVYDNILEGLDYPGYTILLFNKPVVIQGELSTKFLDANSYHSFVPTYSAAALPYKDAILGIDPGTNLAELEKSDNLKMKDYSFLDEIHHQEENTYHAVIGNRVQQNWILEELRRGPKLNSFNRDKKCDLMFFDSDARTIKVTMSTGSSFNTPSNNPWIPTDGFGSDMNQYYPADYNGDGITDLGYWEVGDKSFNVTMGTGSSFGGLHSGKWVKPGEWRGIGGLYYTGDFTGDGRDDLLFFKNSNGTIEVVPSNGEKFDVTKSKVWKAPVFSGFTRRTEHLYPADYNGDGLTDVGYFEPSDNTFRVWLSDGEEFLDGNSFAKILSGGFGHANGYFYTGDFNGDARDDLVFVDAGKTVYVNYSTGNGFGVGVPLHTRGMGSSIAYYYPADYDGDGYCDLGYYEPSIKAFFVCLNKKGVLDQNMQTWIYPFSFINSNGMFYSSRG